MTFPYYAEALDYIAAVTRLLNKLGKELPAVGTDGGGGVYIHVELRETGTHRKIGEWSDEIAEDCWSYSETSEAAS